MALAFTEKASAARSLKIRDQDPAERLVQLGLSGFLHGDYPQAAAHFSAALKLDPANSVLYFQRGEVFRLQCEYERAIADFTTALRLGSANPAQILANRASAFHRSGAHDRAIADAGAALDIEPNKAAYLARAAACAELGSFELALADLTAALELPPEEGEGFYQRGLIYAKTGDFVLAIADFDRALALNAYHVSATFARGNAHRSRNDYTQAIRDYTEVLRHQPNHVLAYSNRALAFKRQGERDRAIADYSEALRLDLASAQNFYHRGVLYRARGDLIWAEGDLDEAIRLQPEHWAALYHRGKILMAQGRFADALADLDEVLSLHPKLVVAYLSRALVHDRMGRYQEAVADSSHAVGLDAASPAVRLVRGFVHAHGNEFVRAIDDLTLAIKLDECLRLAYGERSVAYTLQGDYDRALADCNKLIALEPGSAQAYATRSIVHHFKGELEKALTDYAQALRIDPRCVMSGFNQSLAFTFHSQTSQRIADYIDGLVPELPAAEAPTPAEFRVVVQPVENSPERITGGEATSRVVLSADNTITESLDPDLVQIEEYQVEEIIEDSLSQATPKPVMCPLCSRQEVPAETLSGGRVRCGHCKSLFLPTSSTLSPSSASSGVAGERKRTKQPLKKKADEPEDTSFVTKLKKPVPIAAASIVALLVLYFCYPRNSLGWSNHVPVFPAQGSADFQGKAIPNASIVLHPIGIREPNFPLPHATVKSDGSFVVGTYTEDDGAPAGEYKITVQWFKKVENPEKDDGVVPRNELPAKYARIESSGLSLRIQEGDNMIPLIQLKR